MMKILSSGLMMRPELITFWSARLAFSLCPAGGSLSTLWTRLGPGVMNSTGNQWTRPGKAPVCLPALSFQRCSLCRCDSLIEAVSLSRCVQDVLTLSSSVLVGFCQRKNPQVWAVLSMRSRAGSCSASGSERHRWELFTQVIFSQRKLFRNSGGVLLTVRLSDCKTVGL